MTLKEFKIQWALGTLSINDVLKEINENDDIYHFVMGHADPESSVYICSVFAREINRVIMEEKQNDT